MEVRRQVRIEGVDEAFRGYFLDGENRVLVPGGTPGDLVDVAFLSRSRHHPIVYGEIRRVHRRGSEYVRPECEHAAPVHGRCGGCPGMHLTRELRDVIQFQGVRKALGELGVEPRWNGSGELLGYRNRSNFAVGRKEGEVILGSYAPRSNEVVSMEGCLVVDAQIGAVQDGILRLLNELAVPVGPGEGGLRWVSIRAAGGEVVVELVVTEREAGYVAGLVKGIAVLEGVKGVGVTQNAAETNAVRVEETVMVEGSGELVERYGEVELVITPGAFAQLNRGVAARIYELARAWSEGAKVVWDFYCGIGALGLNLVVGREGARLLGLESVASAVAAARVNGDRNGVLGEWRELNLKDGAALAALEVPAQLQNPDVIAVNPPRKGLSKAVREHLGAAEGAKTLLYMSCDVETFARDARELVAAGWTLQEVEAFDMLPMTTHVELLGCFTR